MHHIPEKSDLLRVPGSEIPFVRILIPYTSGIALVYDLCSPLLLTLFLIFAQIVLIYLCLINICYIKLRGYRFRALNGLVFSFFWISLGAICCAFNNERIRADHFSNAKYDYLKVLVLGEPQQRKGTIRSNVLVVKGYSNNSSKKASGKLMLTILQDSLNPMQVEYGSELIVKAKIDEIRPPHHPAEFNYKTWLATKNIYHQAFLKQREVAVLNRSKGNPVIAFALKLRSEQIAYYQQVFKTKNACAFASTLILGYKSDLGQDIIDIYAKTGTIHVLSVSGMHVGIVYLVFNLILRFMDRRRWTRAIKTTLILLFIWFYALLTGLSPSVLRSAIMISVFIAAKSFSRNSNKYNITAFAAFSLLLYDPFLIWDVGFQLSFLAVLGLIWLQPKIEDWWKTENKWLSKIWSAVAMSLAAQLITYPLSVYYFHQFPVYFLISNLFIMLPAALLMYTGLLILIFRLSILVPVFERLIDFTNKGLAAVNEIPGSQLSAIWISKTELVILYLMVFTFVFSAAYYNKRLLLLAFAFLLCFQSMLAYDQMISLRQRKTVSFHTSKNLIKGFFTGQKAVLICKQKPEPKSFNYFVKPVLDQHKIKQIKWIMISSE